MPQDGSNLNLTRFISTDLDPVLREVQGLRRQELLAEGPQLGLVPMAVTSVVCRVRSELGVSRRALEGNSVSVVILAYRFCAPFCGANVVILEWF